MSFYFWNSQELLDALGLPSSKLPPFIYRMRELGYPPGWLKEAAEENSGLALYDGNGIVLHDGGFILTNQKQLKQFYLHFTHCFLLNISLCY